MKKIAAALVCCFVVASFLVLFVACSAKEKTNPVASADTLEVVKIALPDSFDRSIIPAAHRLKDYLPILKDKKIALVVNQTSTVGAVHLVDTLQRLGCQIMQVFAPEHGFRGKADAGEKVQDGKDVSTNLPIISLYGKNKKPSKEQMQGLDLIVFDIQDVGVRFYTYTSTMTYVMQACAENNVPLLVLDRPNPLGHYVDGPILEKELRSFVGLHPVPVVHGLTVAEYAYMINQEGWLEDGLQCALQHVECLHYAHDKFYQLPIRPSPNLPNMKSIYLYPHLCLFEGTTTSVGRGTATPFQVYGHPYLVNNDYAFVPKSGPGSKNPKNKGKTCFGVNFEGLATSQIQQMTRLELGYLQQVYNNINEEAKNEFFLKTNFFNKLAGNNSLMQQIKDGMPPNDIYQSWEPQLTDYKKMREKYLLYPLNSNQ